MDPVEERLDRIERKLDALMAALRAGGGARASTAGGTEGAIDPDIDGPRGDPEVRFVPKRWTGADCKGQKFSTCEPEFLDMLADAYEWFAQRDDESGALDKNGSPKSRWSRLDAARARAWSARLRGDVSGATPARTPRAVTPAAPRRSVPAPAANGRSMGDFGPAASTDDDIPF
jgi:hypothetical protein